MMRECGVSSFRVQGECICACSESNQCRATRTGLVCLDEPREHRTMWGSFSLKTAAVEEVDDVAEVDRKKIDRYSRGGSVMQIQDNPFLKPGGKSVAAKAIAIVSDARPITEEESYEKVLGPMLNTL
jgi:hypothetical protein